MDANTLLKTYPLCQQAVSFTELTICIPPEGESESSWDMMMAAKTPMSPDEVIEMIREVIVDEVAEGNKGRWKEALEQTNHPSYRFYIMAKMGMM